MLNLSSFRFMTAVLQKVAEKHSSVVAVVGKGHVPGIKSYWEQEISVWKGLF
jgi:pheromone shutdown protein TraB